MTNLRLEIVPTGSNKKAILDSIQEKMTRVESTTTFEEALESFIRHCASGCKLITYTVKDSVISFVVNTTENAKKFAGELERLIKARIHQYIQVVIAA